MSRRAPHVHGGPAGPPFFVRGAAALVGLLVAAGCQAPDAPMRELPPPPERPAVRDPACGPHMVRVDGARAPFCIDVYEAPGFDEVPDSVTLEDAALRCSRRGARLCTEREWERACRGPDGARYPYGDVYRSGWCETQGDAASEAGRHNGCRSGFGVYDMSGNAAEWVEGGLLKGGDARSDDFASRCGTRALPDEPGAPELRGVRCCKDLVTVP